MLERLSCFLSVYKVCDYFVHARKSDEGRMDENTI